MKTGPPTPGSLRSTDVGCRESHFPLMFCYFQCLSKWELRVSALLHSRITVGAKKMPTSISKEKPGIHPNQLSKLGDGVRVGQGSYIYFKMPLMFLMCDQGWESLTWAIADQASQVEWMFKHVSQPPAGIYHTPEPHLKVLSQVLSNRLQRHKY